jgi:hypothetical protein
LTGSSKFAAKADDSAFASRRIAAVEFQSANPTIIKSIKQRDLLNTWLRLYASAQMTPAIQEYQPERLADELPDLVYYTVDTAPQPPRLLIQSDGTRMSSAYGNTGKGRYFDDYLGPRLVPVVMPVYYECIKRASPSIPSPTSMTSTDESSPMSGC